MGRTPMASSTLKSTLVTEVYDPGESLLMNLPNDFWAMMTLSTKRLSELMYYKRYH